MMNTANGPMTPIAAARLGAFNGHGRRRSGDG